MGAFGDSVAFGVYFQPPVDAVDFLRLRIDDAFTQLRIVYQFVVEFMEFGDKFMAG